MIAYLCGVFDIVAVIPPCSTWSRARHADTEGQKPLRSRSHPLGLPALTESEQQKVDKANENLELALWISLQTLRCTVKPVELLFVAPEDFGGHATNGPASVWQFREVQDLGALNEAQRAAGFLCQLSRADQKRPLGFVSTLPSFTQLLCAGWPNLELNEVYGPLPKDCPCASPHTAMVGLSKDSTFMSSISPTLGILFWTNIWKAYMEPFSLRDGEEHIQKGPFQYDHSLSSRSGSWVFPTMPLEERRSHTCDPQGLGRARASGTLLQHRRTLQLGTIDEVSVVATLFKTSMAP